MLKSILVASALTLASANFAVAGGDPSPGAVSPSGTILGTVSVASANQAIAAVGLGDGQTLRGTTATVSRTPTGDMVVTTDGGGQFIVQAGFVAQLILAYFT